MQYRNLAAEMTRANMTAREVSSNLDMTEANFSLKMCGKRTWKLKEMTLIQDIINQKLDKNYTLDYLFEPYKEGA